MLWFITLGCICLAKDFEYRFEYNFDTEVFDFLNNNLHGTKPARGTNNAVNTSYGLYLNGQTVQFPCSEVIKHNQFGLRLFVRYLQGFSGNISRELITLLNGNDQGLQFRQQSATETSNPKFELIHNLKAFFETSIQANGPYLLSKLYADMWYYFRIEAKKSKGQTTTYVLCINSVEVANIQVKKELGYDWSKCYLNGAKTTAIYYRFHYEDTFWTASCNTSSYPLSVNGTPCDYVCPSSTSRLCDVNSYNYDYDCRICTFGAYGCVTQGSPEIDWTDSCPPWPYTTTNCNNCYSGSIKDTNDYNCICPVYKESLYPLICSSNLYTATLPFVCSTLLTNSATAGDCELCFNNAYTLSPLCKCNPGYVDANGSATVVIDCVGNV